MKVFIIQNGKEHIINFCDEFEYPNEAKDAVLEVFDVLMNNASALEKTADMCKRYKENYAQNEEETVNALVEIAEELEVNAYTFNLMYFIFLVPDFNAIYKEKGYSEELRVNTLLDLKYKLFECKNRHGVWGNFVAKWTIGIFALEIFSFGRLQFNMYKCPCDYTYKGYTIKAGDNVISTHIPSSGPLLREEYLKSYAKAEKFFKEYFPAKPTVFYCCSWIVAPTNEKILPETSRIREFANDFIKVREFEETNHSDLWRIFGVDKFENADDLPQDTSLRRAFANWLKKGEYICCGTGIMFYDNGIIL